MDLQFLNGLGDAALYRDVNDQYLMSLDDELGELGKLLAKKSKIPGAKTNLFAKIKDEVAAKKAQAPPADPLALPKKKKKGCKEILIVCVLNYLFGIL